jgi:hypothetical protein
MISYLQGETVHMATAEKAGKHPYISGTGGIASALTQFRKAFPTKVTADTLKKLAIAPNNESYVINILRFLNVIDAEGNRTQTGTSVFSKHDQSEFQEVFGKLVKDAYVELFNLHGDGAWALDENKLISFFRGNDQTSDIVGRRQASTFQTLASFAGHGEIPTPKSSSGPKVSSDKKNGAKKQAAAKNVAESKVTDKGGAGAEVHFPARDVGLTVRIEVNLPPAGDQETYDRIFRSIRENLLNAK